MRFNRQLALGILFSLALAAAVLGHSGMKRVVVGPSDSNSPLVRALSRVTDYDVYRNPVIVQAAWSRKKELSIIFFAEENASAKRQIPERAPWQIEVLFGQNALARNPRLVARGISRLAVRGQAGERIRLGKAVAVAVSSWDAERVVDPPLLIDARTNRQGYGGTIWRLPQVPGGVVGFEVSKDLKHYRITPGE